MTFKRFFIDETYPFTHDCLKSGWAKRHLNITGTPFISFIGPYNSSIIPFENDIKDFSKKTGLMLHMIIEHKRVSRLEIELFRYTFSHLLIQYLGPNFSRYHTLCYYDEKLINFSILRHTKQSGIIYFGFFIQPDGHLPIIGLDHFDLAPKDFSLQMMQRYHEEYRAICEEL